MLKSSRWGGWVGWWPPRLLHQPQSPLGPFGALLGMELGWVWGDWGLRGWGLGLDNNEYYLVIYLRLKPFSTEPSNFTLSDVIILIPLAPPMRYTPEAVAQDA